MHHHPLSPPSLFCLPLQVESIAPVSCHMVPGNRIPAYYYLSPSLWCQCSCGCRSWLEVRGTFNGGCCGRTDGRTDAAGRQSAHLLYPPGCTSPESPLITRWIPGQSPLPSSSQGLFLARLSVLLTPVSPKLSFRAVLGTFCDY